MTVRLRPPEHGSSGSTGTRLLLRDTAAARSPLPGAVPSGARSVASRAAPPPRGPDLLRRLTVALLMVFAFTLPLQRVVQVAGIGTISRAVGLVLVAAAAAALLWERPRHRLVDAHVVLAGFTGWVLASSMWTDDLETTTQFAFTTVQLLVMLLVVTEFADDLSRLRALLGAYVAGALATTAVLAYRFVIVGVEAERVSASDAAHPNDIAFLLCLAAPMAWYLSVAVRARLLTGLLRLAVPALLTGIVLTASRSALLIVAVGLTLIVPLTAPRMSSAARVVTVIGGIAAVVAVLLLAPSPQRQAERLATIDEEITTGTLSNRTELWDAALDVSADAPLVGVGPGVSRQTIGERTGAYERAHNTYLSVLAELGVVGLGLFVVALVLVGVHAARAFDLERRLALALGATLLTGLAPRHWEYEKATWFVLGLLLAFGLVGQRLTDPAVTPGDDLRRLRARLSRWRSAPAVVAGPLVVLAVLAGMAWQVAPDRIAAALRGDRRTPLVPLPAPVGFASTASVDGGAGGREYWVTTLADDGPGSLRQAADPNEPVWVRFAVDGTIDLQRPLDVSSDVTIDGRDAAVTISGAGFSLDEVEDVILVNLTFAGGRGADSIDAVHIEDGTRGVWIDHCTFTDYPDGLVDITRGATDVTVSNSHFRDHRNVMLVDGGEGERDAPEPAEPARVTLHGNYFDTTFAGHPLARWAHVHLFNNYFRHWGTADSGSAIQSDAGAQIRSEHNVFEPDVRERAVFSDADATPRGLIASNGDMTLNSADIEQFGSSDVFNPSRSYGYLPQITTRDLARRIAADAGVHPPSAYPETP